MDDGMGDGKSQTKLGNRRDEIYMKCQREM